MKAERRKLEQALVDFWPTLLLTEHEHTHTRPQTPTHTYTVHTGSLDMTMEWMTAGSGHGSGSSRASGDGPELPERYRLPYLGRLSGDAEAEKYGLALDRREDGSFYRGFGGKAWPPTRSCDQLACEALRLVR